MLRPEDNYVLDTKCFFISTGDLVSLPSNPMQLHPHLHVTDEHGVAG